MTPRSVRCSVLSFALVALPLALAGAAGAASAVFADVAGICNGASPCFLTIQEAVDNAGPGPATVGVFPGLYAESVDLVTMGAAVGGGPADLVLHALDAAGVPATAGVAIDPGAAGGPGAGPAIFPGGAPFPGAITLRGLHLTSPDVIGVILFADGDVVVEHVVVEGCGGAGGFAITPGSARLTALEARLNAGTGWAARAGTVEVDGIVAERNDGYGVRVFGETSLAVTQVIATANGEGGVEGTSCNEVQGTTLVGEANGGSGVLLAAIPSGHPDCTVSTLGSSEGLASAAGLSSPEVATWVEEALAAGRPSLRLKSSHPQPVVASGLRALGNGDRGIVLASEGEVTANGLEARDNAESGLFVLAGSAELADATVTDNTSGMVVFAGIFTIAQVVASDNAAAFLPPLQGAGVVVLAGSGGLDDVLAERNAFAGIVLLAPPPPSPSPIYVVTNSRVGDNRYGLTSAGDDPVTVTLLDLEAEGNVAVGISLPNLLAGEIQRATSVANGFGLDADVGSSLHVLESEIADNLEGVRLAVQPGAEAIVGCSNLRGNAGSGLEMLAGDGALARGNFWGAASGPTHPGNPGGTGDTVTDGANGGTGVVDYAGFLANPATAADCPQVSVLEIPAAGDGALAALAALLALAGMLALRRS